MRPPSSSSIIKPPTLWKPSFISSRPRPTPAPVLPPETLPLSPVFNRPSSQPQQKCLYSSSSSLMMPYINTNQSSSPSPMQNMQVRGFATSGKRNEEKIILGVEGAVKAKEDSGYEVKPRIFDEFSLKDRVAVVTGANGGLGLEMALALCEAGAHVHALDLPSSPSSDFLAVQEFVSRLPSPPNSSSPAKITYHSADVTNQSSLSTLIHSFGPLHICVAAAGILGPVRDEQGCLGLKEEDWKRVLRVNTDGVFFTAQAAARGMKEGGVGGSVILIASMSGSITNRDQPWVAYNTSKSAVLQMARSMACELGKYNIRVNSISPGHIYTKMTAALLDIYPETQKVWEDSNPLGRLGKVHELRGVVTWLASDASSFCTGSDILVSGGHHAW